jgi:hypothetical protein
MSIPSLPSMGPLTPVNRFAYDRRPLDQYPPWGDPLPRAEAVEIAKDGLVNFLRILDEAAEARAKLEYVHGRTLSQEPDELRLRDHTLQPIHDLKFEGPFTFHGPCGHRIAYAGLNPWPEQSGLIVLLAPNVDRSPGGKGGALKLRGYDRKRPIMSTRDMIEDAMGYASSRIQWAEAGPRGDPKGRSWTVTCPRDKCHAAAHVTNGLMVTRFLETVIAGDGEMWLAGRASGRRAEREGSVIRARSR